MYRIKQGQKICNPVQDFPSRSFQIKSQLGKGEEGQVYLAKPENWNKNFDVALKIQESVNETEYDFITKLIDIQNNRDELGSQTYRPTNIIRIFDLFNYQGLTIQVMEVGDLNLFEYMKKNQQTLSHEQKMQICYQLLNAISYIHEKGLIHRDIKGENFILVGKEFKLIDFGLLSVKNRLMTSKGGTRIFQAPELLESDKGELYTQAIDTWALGCVFYEIFGEQELFPCHKMSVSLDLIKNHKKDQNYIYSIIDNLKVSQQWKELIKQMLHPKQMSRINVKDCMKKVKLFIQLESDPTMIKTLNNLKKKEQKNDQELQQNDFLIIQQIQEQEFNNTIKEKNQTIRQLGTQIRNFEEQIEDQKNKIYTLEKKISKLETENKNLKQQNEESTNRIRQYEDQIQMQYINQNKSNLQIQNYMNQQANSFMNQQAQSFFQQKQILENEIQILKKKNLELEDKLKSNIFDSSKSNQETIQVKLKNQNVEQNSIIEQVKFLEKLIENEKNEITNLEQSLKNFQAIQKILNFNNIMLNSQIIDLEKLIQEKKSKNQNYEKIQLEIQKLDQQKIQSPQFQIQDPQLQQQQGMFYTQQEKIYGSQEDFLQKQYKQLNQQQKVPTMPQIQQIQQNQNNILRPQFNQGSNLQLNLINPVVFNAGQNQIQQQQNFII
ncbi:unnamed protein product [Paramecium sonneborni]|uniref:Protein kinase domain-containing protein n=1 Tax=Paramecium sonneborni TaxID=65129 RepID=A0A8S1MT38_9CILI|nr:unnamed protein product [Paramecium sonneborni]